jgi:hypothetical protein
MHSEAIYRNSTNVMEVAEHISYRRIKEAVINEEALAPFEVTHLSHCSDCLQSVRFAVRDRLRTERQLARE